MASAQTFEDLRIGEGGLLRRFELASHLTTLPRQIALVVGVTWLPVMVLGLFHEWRTGLREPLIHYAPMHVRMLVAAPVLLFLDHIFPPVCRDTLAQLVMQSFLPG